jgi:ribosomal protein S18 acetylase RimI-like enzyme
MTVTAAVPSDLHKAVACLTAAFAHDPITGFVLQTGQGYSGRLTQFFSLLMRARLALQMPVLVAQGTSDIHGAVMGYTTLHPAWPADITEEWGLFEKATPGIAERLSAYEEIAEKFKPPVPHYYLGAIGVDPTAQGRGIGAQLLKSFCDRSAADHSSCGVYLETAKASNVAFYERAGFVETGRGMLGSNTLWCMYLTHRAPTSNSNPGQVA